MSEELISIVDESGRIIGEEKRSVIHEKGLLHRETYVYLINSQKQVLLQRRADIGLWDNSCAGHFSSSETYLEGAQREFKEELGIMLSKDQFAEIGYDRLVSKRENYQNIRLAKVFLVEKDIPLSDFVLDRNEVLEVKYFALQELKKLKDITRTSKFLIEKYVLKRLE